MIRILLILSLMLFVVGCTQKYGNEKEMISVLDINKKIQALELRVSKTEKRVEEFSVIALAIAKKEQMEFPVDETSKLAQTYASVEVVNKEKENLYYPLLNLTLFYLSVI